LLRSTSALHMPLAYTLMDNPTEKDLENCLLVVQAVEKERDNRSSLMRHREDNGPAHPAKLTRSSTKGRKKKWGTIKKQGRLYI